MWRDEKALAESPALNYKRAPLRRAPSRDKN